MVWKKLRTLTTIFVLITIFSAKNVKEYLI